MGVLEDVRNWLKEIPLWRDLEKIPPRMDALEKRVAALENALERVPGDACPKCGARAMRLKEQSPPLGDDRDAYRFEQWQCTDPACGHTEERKVKL
jgi:hypothetical protein